MLYPVHPHGRGDGESGDLHQRLRLRFTPTGVGTASNAQAYGGLVAVHPHGRGDGAL